MVLRGTKVRIIKTQEICKAPGWSTCTLELTAWPSITYSPIWTSLKVCRQGPHSAIIVVKTEWILWESSLLHVSDVTHNLVNHFCQSHLQRYDWQSHPRAECTSFKICKYFISDLSLFFLFPCCPSTTLPIHATFLWSLAQICVPWAHSPFNFNKCSCLFLSSGVHGQCFACCTQDLASLF